MNGSMRLTVLIYKEGALSRPVHTNKFVRV